jgi:hypothetical protein
MPKGKYWDWHWLTDLSMHWDLLTDWYWLKGKPTDFQMQMEKHWGIHWMTD